MNNKDVKEIYDNLKKNSICNDRIKMNLKKIVIPSILSLSTIFVSLSLYIDHQKNNYMDNNITQYESGRTYNYTYIQSVVDNLISYEISNVRMKLVTNNIDTGNGINLNNSVEDYKTIHDLNKKDLYGFYELVQRNEIETEKVIKALGYNDWKDFLIKENCIDRDGKASIAVWRNDEKQRIYDEYYEVSFGGKVNSK